MGRPGRTWSNDDPAATQLLWPDRRIDYINLRRGGAGHPRRTVIVGDQPINGVFPSDRYALQAELRY